MSTNCAFVASDGIFSHSVDVYLTGAVVGKHPDLMVAHPTPTIFPTIGRNFEIS
jgi:hypothetical protein